MSTKIESAVVSILESSVVNMVTALKTIVHSYSAHGIQFAYVPLAAPAESYIRAYRDERAKNPEKISGKDMTKELSREGITAHLWSSAPEDIRLLRSNVPVDMINMALEIAILAADNVLHVERVETSKNKFVLTAPDNEHNPHLITPTGKVPNTNVARTQLTRKTISAMFAAHVARTGLTKPNPNKSDIAKTARALVAIASKEASPADTLATAHIIAKLPMSMLGDAIDSNIESVVERMASLLKKSQDYSASLMAAVTILIDDAESYMERGTATRDSGPALARIAKDAQIQAIRLASAARVKAAKAAAA